MDDDTTHQESNNHKPEWYRTLVEEVNDLATVVDTDGTITYVSPAITRILGYDPGELVGHEGFEFVHPEDRERNADALESVLSNPSGSETVEVRFRHANGSWRWIEATMRNRVDDDIIDGILLSSRDITERKEYEREARELAEEYEAVLNSVEDAIFLMNVEEDGDGVQFEFERLSPSYERQTGITTEEVQGQTPQAVFGEEQGAELAANYHRCVKAGEPISYQEELLVSEGARFWQTKLAPVVSDGEITRLVGVTRNVTERVERERQLRQQNERLGEFASVISHDLRSPLNVAQGRAALLAEQGESEHLDPLLQALDRMEAIVEDTLTLARQGDTISETESVSLTNLVGKCWATVDTGEAAIEIVDEMTLQADPDRLRHVFENLFRNAVEHGGSDVTVRVGCHNELGIYVEDNGPGIPVEKRDEVFEPGHSSAQGGTGFGLTIVKRIVEAHGWELSVADGTDGGARFEFEMSEQGEFV
ncbi:MULTISPECIES: PAS domain S-box protein [Halorubrum]|nr:MULTISPECIES: PAS domain S-box protein [Halorubrum]MDB9254067.1 PAS domain S-box protein [Halorubrum ezzemoulense]MDB9257492.1 PAS domain S-box protein [Halorubrum ezzemoulense]MDB9278133.1 PAS domain S-box protein [Halorubrum ezzemoulense]TKX64993.1 PAS domain S-box protein [Halorubrum sp. GN12_10-3_MGM]